MYFEKESLQNNIGDDLDKRNRNFEKIESDTVVSATNLITNGDFSSDVIGWVAQGGTLSVADIDTVDYISAPKSLKITGTDTWVRRYQAKTVTVGNKYYVATHLKSTNVTGGFRFAYAYGDLGNYPMGFLINSADAMGWTKTSSIFLATATNLVVGVTAYISVGEAIWLDNTLLIDLTATFGKGNEPTVEQMDEIMSKFENSWFDGTANLFRAKEALNTIRNLYTDKANKVQEAWITPTLLNGWTSDSGNPIQYRKDEFGRVWVRGRCFGTTPGSIAFAFPSGYRPTIFHDPICSKFNTNTASIGFGRVSVHPSGDLYIHSSTISSERFDLSGVSFSTN